MKRRSPFVALAALGVTALGVACGDGNRINAPVVMPTDASRNVPINVTRLSAPDTAMPELFEICKRYTTGSGPTVQVRIQVKPAAPPALDSIFTLASGECKDVWVNGSATGTDTVTATEVVPAGYTSSIIQKTVYKTSRTTRVYSRTGPTPGNSATGPVGGPLVWGQTIDFINAPIPGGSVGDFVWYDVNGNGVQDASEPGLANVPVTIAGANLPAGYPTTQQTNANGGYLFTGLLAGTYTVTVATPAGYVASPSAQGGDPTQDSNGSPATVTLATNTSSDLTIDFGFTKGLGTIGDFVWDDLNGNGVQDAGEPGIAGVPVTLSGAASATTTTNANGGYLFQNLFAGNYTVTVGTPAGYSPSPSNAGGDSNLDSNGSPASVTLPTNISNDMSIDFGFVQNKTGQIGDFVWNDQNGNGVQDAGEPGLSGVTVTLSGTANATTTTDANGGYLFDNLGAGSYTVTVGTPAGFAPTTANAGGDPAKDSNGSPATVTLATNQSVDLTIDFGYVPLGSVGDFVWNDANRNGVQEPGEPGIANATVQLFDSNGTVLQTTQTNGAGLYSFVSLPAGSYKVCVTQPAGLLPTYDLDGTATANCATFTLGVGQNRTDVDFGYAPPPTNGSIGDRVWNDANGNGAQESGEAGLPGWTVTISGANLPAGHTTTQTTGANGIYTFTGLPAGTYTVCVTPAASYMQTYDLDGLATPNCAQRTITGTEQATDVDFGYNQAAPPMCPAPNPIFGLGAAGDYSVLGLSNTYLVVSAAATQVAGNVGLGANGTGSLLKATIGGQLRLDPTASPSIAPDLIVNGGIVTQSMAAPVSSAIAASSNLAALPPTNTLGTISSSTVVNGNGGLNVVNVAAVKLVKGTLTIQGGPNDVFVFNVSGDFTFSSSQMVLQGTRATNIVWNIIGTGPDVAVFKDVTVTFGTFLISQRKAVFDQGTVYGSIIGGVDLRVHSGTLVLCPTEPPTGSIGDRVWLDTNGNGVQEGTEAGLSGWTVTITGTNVPSPYVTTRSTDTAGEYLFGNLPAGTYRVCVTPAAGYTQTYDLDGLATPNCADRTIGSNQNATDVDFGYRIPVLGCVAGPVGGIDLGPLPNYLFFFANGSQDANWQGATKGFRGDVFVDGILASERTSGGVPYAGTITTNDATLGAWQAIVNQNPGQAFASFGKLSTISTLKTTLNNAFAQINALPVTAGYANRSAASLNGINTQNGVKEVTVIDVTSGFSGISAKLNVTGDAGDIFIMRWDTDAIFSNGYQGTVKFQSGGAIVPKGGLTAGSFIHVAGNLNSSGGGSNPPLPYPQGPRYNDGTGALITGGANWNGGGFFTGYWLTTGSPDSGDTSPFSNAIFVGGWYTLSDKFSMTSGTSGVQVCPNQ